MTGTEKNDQLNKSPLFAHIEKVVYLTHEETEKAMNEGFLRREIIFRGKRSDNGEWVEGGVEYNSTTRLVFIVSSFNTHTIINRVNPKTVSEFTGLTDKNGKKIFEGDIVKHYNHCEIKEYSEDIGRVFYYSETCRFLRTSKLFPDDCPEIHSNCEYEVIGNIHDNPELLKGGAE